MFRRFGGDRSGATSIEYGVIALVGAAAVLIGADYIGSEVKSSFGKIEDALSVNGDPEHKTQSFQSGVSVEKPAQIEEKSDID